MFTADASLAPAVLALHDGALDLREYLKGLCDRIDTVEPEVRALLPEPGRRERLLAAAGAAGGPLAGVPVAVKDIYRVDGFPTRAGTMVPLDGFDGPEASAVTRLRARGALILGKSVTTEFAMLAPGATRNPHDTGRTPGGSSSGSAAAVAAGFCPLALGTQTVGSMIRPAAFCGVVGFKPSYGRVPLDGVVPVSPSADTVGLFTQDLAGMELAAAALIGDWEPATVEGPPRVAVPDGPYLDEAKPVARRPLKGMRRVRAFDWKSIRQAQWDVVLAEFAASHADRFPRYASLYRPGTARLLDRGRGIDAAAVEAGRASMAALRVHLHALMDDEGIDVWASPAARGKAPKGQDATGDPALNLPWSHAGLPTVTIPARPARGGMPIGLQLSARFGDDEKLLAWARHLVPNSSV